MNQKIKQVLKNHNILYPQINEDEITKVTSLDISVSVFEKILIDICELQKEECSKESKIRFWDGFHKEGKLIEHFQSGGDNLTPSKESILNSKNIAE